MAKAWKLLLPIIHGIGNQDAEMQGLFEGKLLAETKGRVTPKLVDDHLLTFRPVWDSNFSSQSDAWMSLLLYDDARDRLKNSNLAEWNLTDHDLKEQIWHIARDRAMGKVSASLRAAGGAAAFTLFPGGTDPLIAAGRAIDWGAANTLGREFQAHTLSDIIMYLSDEPRTQIIKALLRGAWRTMDDQYRAGEVDDNTKLYVIFCAHSLGSIIAYDFLRAIVKWNNPQNKALAAAGGITDRQRGTTEFNPELLAENSEPGDFEPWGFSMDMFQRLNPLGMITFGAPISFFLFRSPGLIANRTLWEGLCPQIYQAYMAGAGKDYPDGCDWRWLNIWHANDFVAHRCEPFLNLGLDPRRKFVEDIQVDGGYAQGVEAHSSYWGEGSLDKEAGRATKDIICGRAKDLLIGLKQAEVDGKLW
jgi:hypothetical protein